MQPPLQSILIISDCHRPFHQKQAWELVLQVGRYLRPFHIVVNGDFLDAFSISSHSKDPSRQLQLKEEIEDANQGLDDLDDLCANHCVFVAGNHEHRMDRYISDRAPELFGLTDIPSLLHLKERGWSYTAYKKHTKLGRLHITHDVGTAGRFASYKALDTYQHSITTGHTHRMSYVVEGNALGEHKLSASFGWLGDVEAIDYMQEASAKKAWSLGFGCGYTNPENGLVYLTPVPIINYADKLSCIVNGTYFEVPSQL